MLAQFGPSRGHPFMPTASAPGELSAAARKHGVLPMPALEWNAQVEREPRTFMSASRTWCRRSSGRSSRLT